MVPFVNELIAHARVGMLRRDTQPDQLQPQARHLLDHVRHIGEPPATEDVQVPEFAGQHTETVLILA